MEVGCWKSPQNHPGSTFVYSIDILTAKNKFDEWFWEIQETQHFYILLWPSDQVRTIYYVMGKHICCPIPPEKHVIPHQDFLAVCCKGLILLVLKEICVQLYFTFSYRGCNDQFVQNHLMTFSYHGNDAKQRQLNGDFNLAIWSIRRRHIVLNW